MEEQMPYFPLKKCDPITWAKLWWQTRILSGFFIAMRGRCPTPLERGEK